jgi:hypothetical protein
MGSIVGERYKDSSPSMRLVAVAFLGFVVSCSSHHPQLPPELSDCTPSENQPCAKPPLVGGATGTGPAGSGVAGTGDSGAVGSSGCGGAESLLLSTDPTCGTCAVTSCCAMAGQCLPGDCQNLLVCNQGCQGNTACIGNCEITYASGQTAYSGFRGCLSLNCTTCPTLPQ